MHETIRVGGLSISIAATCPNIMKLLKTPKHCSYNPFRTWPVGAYIHGKTLKIGKYTATMTYIQSQFAQNCTDPDSYRVSLLCQLLETLISHTT